MQPGPVPRRLDLDIARLARRQHGAWSRVQALDLGLSSKMIRGRTASGSWVTLDHGVYAHVASAATWERSVMAAVLAEPWAVASHQSAAVLHGLHGFRPGRPVVTIRPGANARGRLAIRPPRRGRAGDGGAAHPVRHGRAGVRRPRPGRGRAAAPCGARAVTCDEHPSDLDRVRDRYCELAPRGGRNLRRLKATLLALRRRRPARRERAREADAHRLRGPRHPAPSSGRRPSRDAIPGSRRVDGLHARPGR